MQGGQANNRIAKNTIFLYIRMGFVLVVSLFTTRIVLQSLGVEDYGINNVVGGFVSMFAFLNTSMSNGIQRFYNFAIGRKNEYSEKDVYNTAILIQTLLAIIIIVLLETIGIWYMYNKMVIPDTRFGAAMWVFQLAVASLVFVIIQIPYSAAIIAYEKMDFFAYVSIFDVIAKLAIAYSLFICKGDKLIIYGILNFAVCIISFFLYFFFCKLKFKSLKLEIRPRKTLFKSMLSFSGWNIFGTFAYMIKSQGLNMLLNVFFGPIINAARGISNMVLSAIQGFQSNIVVAFRPQIVQSYAAGEYSRVKNLFYSLSKVSFVLLATLSVPVMMEHKYIFHLWLGDTIPDYTYSFTILVLINMIISSLNTPVSQVVHATGKMKTYQILTSSVICAILPISWLFLKIGFDPNSVYVVSLAVTIVNQYVCIAVLKRIFEFEMKEYLKEVIIPLTIYSIVLVIIPLLCIFVLDSNLWRLILIFCLTVLISGAMTYLIVLNSSEKNIVNSFVNNKLRRTK